MNYVYKCALRNRIPRANSMMDGETNRVTMQCNECDESWEYDADEFETLTMLGTTADMDLISHAEETEDDGPGHHDVDVMVEPVPKSIQFVDTTITVGDTE